MPENRLFDTADRTLEELWDRFLDLQVDIAFDLERQVILGCDEWQRARTVLDVGTGNGRWLRRVAALCPDKSFTGSDPSAELVRIARSPDEPANVRFVVADLHSQTGSFDFVILRAVVQHLTDYDRVVPALRDLLAEGGSFLAIDNDPASGRTFPPAPLTAAAYAAIARHQRARHGTGDPEQAPFDRFRRAVEACPGVDAVDEQVVIVPSTLPGNEARFQEHTMVALHLFRAAGEVDADFDGAIAEWREWCTQPWTYNQIGVRFLLVSRTGG